MDAQCPVAIVDDDGYGTPSSALSGTSTAQSLCDDVLYNIFLFGLPSNVALYPEGAFILNVGQVCRAWRSVTASNPSLWAEVTWDPLEGDEASLDTSRLERATLLFRYFLSRSQDSPLSIIIHSSSPTRPSFASFEDVVVCILDRDTQCRLKDLTLHCVATDLSPTHAYMIINAPLLETLDVDITNWHGGELYVDTSYSPRLRTLSLIGQVRLSTNYLRDAPSAILRSMILRTTTEAGNWWMQADTLVDFLRHLPSLELICFDIQPQTMIHANTTMRRPPLSLIRADNIVTMDLTFNQTPLSTANKLLKHLELPRLKTLNLDYDFNVLTALQLHTWSGVDCLKTVEVMTICYGITEATGFGLAVRDEEIVSLLRFAPSLLHLTIRDVPLSGQIFEALAIMPDSNYESSEVQLLCPLLEIISIENRDTSFNDFPIPSSAVIGALNNRHHIRVSLPSIRQRTTSVN